VAGRAQPARLGGTEAERFEGAASIQTTKRGFRRALGSGCPAWMKHTRGARDRALGVALFCSPFLPPRDRPSAAELSAGGQTASPGRGQWRASQPVSCDPARVRARGAAPPPALLGRVLRLAAHLLHQPRGVGRVQGSLSS